MKHAHFSRLFAAWLALAVLLSACEDGATVNGTPVVDRPSNAIEISIVYAPEFAPFMPQVINDFNRAFAESRNPVTGQALAAGERPIFVTGKDASSGVVMQGIVNAVIAPNNANVERPTIWSPSVSHWLALANYQAGRELFDLANSPPTALAPVVIAIWESRLKAIQAKHPGQPIGWEELLEVLNDPNGWAAYGIAGRTTVYYGHTDPYVSSTALSTLIAEFYSSARYNSNNPGLRRLTLDLVNQPQVQQGVRQIEQLIKHYSSRTTEFKEYIAQGPEYLDFVALEENDLIYINQGKTQYQPPERLVALYPKEGTFWHEHPFSIPTADWVTAEQRAAAQLFTEYVRSKPVQEVVLSNGFRPATTEVPLGYPVSSDLGVDPAQPATVLDVPDPAVISAVQASWQYVKKQADVLMLIDVSGSMSGDKIDQARQAALAFLDRLPAQNRVGLMTFNHLIEMRVSLDSFERNRDDMRRAVENLEADGDTALFDAVIEAVNTLSADEGDRIRAIVLLSDGQDTASVESLNAMTNVIHTGRAGKNPILIIPVAYGSDADINALNAVARTSSTRVQSGDPANIQNVLEIISSYF
ncbi:MAG TPA: VWA domain-containing protein [Anaerolineae bacterium]|nr:VWA domain-containing protein [Anaerolineae bacterium]